MTDSTAERFALLDLDLPPAPQPAPQPARRALSAPPAAVAARPAPQPEVCIEGRDRAMRDEAAARAVGWAPEPPIFAIGSKVNSIGVENFRAKRAEFEALPTRLDAMDQLDQLVSSEKRQDHVVKVPQLAFDAECRVSRGGGALALSERALEGLATHVTPGGAGYLRACPPELRATNLNHWAKVGRRVDERATAAARAAWARRGRQGPEPAPVTVDRELTLRTRLDRDGRRHVWSAVGPKYAAHDIDALARQIRDSAAIPRGARAQVVYDGYSARIDLLWHTDVQPERAVAGEIFRAGVIIRTADDGSGAVRVEAQIQRNLCLNLIIVDTQTYKATRRTHRGRGIAASVEDGIARASKRVEHFAAAWSDATVENVIERYGVSDIESVLRGLVYHEAVHVPGVSPAELHARLTRAYYAEPGYGRDAVINAITRAAHTEEWPRWTDTEDLERTAGELLFARAWHVAVPDDARADLDY